jgi:hypothetical protein
MRRKSEIAKKQVISAEDSQVVRFIGDLRSAGTSPPQFERKQQDSGGGFSSDQLLNTNQLNQNLTTGQRKSSVSNFTAKSQPQPNT